MKILIASAVYYPMINGVAVFSHNLAVGLAERGHEVLVICPSQNGKNYTETVDGVNVNYLRSVQAKIYPDQIHELGGRKRFFYKHGFRVSVFPQPEVRKILKKFRPDVVHVQVSDPIGLSVVYFAKKYRIPVVTTEHNQPEVITEPLKIPMLVKKPMNALLAAYFVNRQSKSDFVTMPTKQAISNLILSRDKEFSVPVAAVSNGVDLKNFKPGPVSKELYRKYGLKENYLTVLNLGRLDPEKNVGAVIEAFLMAEKEVKNIQLAIVGDGVDRPRLEKLAKASQNVHFLGRITPPELYVVYRLGNVFATASEIETQGIVLIEAAATGLPLIAVDKGAVSEVCINNENGYLCQPNDIEGISKAMRVILSDQALREKFAKKSLEIAHEHDFENTLDKFENIYNKVIMEKG